MGTFFDSIHIRCEQIEALVDRMSDWAKGRFSYILTPPSDGWISLFLDENGIMIDDIDDEICLKLSQYCNSLVLKIKEHDSDVFYYTCFFNGNVIDSFDSCPDYFENVTNDEKNKLHGKPERWVDLLGFSVEVNELREVLDLMQSDLLCENDGPERFVRLLHLNDALTSYDELITEEPEPEWIIYDCSKNNQ
ncbi:MAG: hypothetical protein LBC02_13715 [Planctomycetaceae bacterium]|jgi:hypothetical protein|nr:hypothetical protein [Planctomycetaceae bacterium]